VALVLSVERNSCHCPRAWNFEVASRFLENLCAPALQNTNGQFRKYR
jgi:hypothetical protein